MGLMRHISSEDFKMPELVRFAAEQSLGIRIAEISPAVVDTPLCSGKMLVSEVQPGLLVAATELTYLTDAAITSESEPSVSCGVLVEGEDETMEVAGYGPITRKPGCPAVKGFSRPTRFRLPGMRSRTSRAAGILIQPSFFERFGQGFDESGIAALREFAEAEFRYECLPKSPKLTEIARGCLENPYNGQLCKLYLESNALAFVVEISQLLSHERRMIALIGKRHYERVMEARSILDENLVNPPTIIDLTRRVGINLTTLQANFKLVFGTTIFGYVRLRRLMMARVLLTEHHLSIAEAGYRVGFSSPSAFTAAYRRHFGYPPGRETRSN